MNAETAPPSGTSAVSDDASLHRTLVISSPKVAWRAEGTPSGEAATVEVTTDGGNTWQPTDPGISAVVRLTAYGHGGVFVVGANADCNATLVKVTAPDRAWQTDQQALADTWYQMPDNPLIVHAPGGDKSRPCLKRLMGLASIGSYRAVAVCGNGRLKSLNEAGHWTTLMQRGAVAVNADNDRFVVVRTSSGCSGLTVQTFDAKGDGLTQSGADSARSMHTPDASRFRS